MTAKIMASAKKGGNDVSAGGVAAAAMKHRSMTWRINRARKISTTYHSGNVTIIISSPLHAYLHLFTYINIRIRRYRA